MKKIEQNYIDEELREEEEIIAYIEEGNPVIIENLDEEKNRYQKIFKDNFQKRKPINLRILEHDLYLLKKQALIEGIPYQTLIGSVIHKYVRGLTRSD